MPRKKFTELAPFIGPFEGVEQFAIAKSQINPSEPSHRVPATLVQGTIRTLDPNTVPGIGSFSIALYDWVNERPVRENVSAFALSVSARNVRIAAWFSGLPGNGELMVRIPMADNVMFFEDFPLSHAISVIGSTGLATFSVRKNGVEVGTFTYTDSDVGVFESPGDVLYTPGDSFEIVAPAPQNSTISGVGLQFVGAIPT